MKTSLLHIFAIAIAALATACAGFEQALSPIAPTGSAASVASLLGTWTSSSSIGAGVNSCTNFQWKVTAQQGNTVSGDFSAVCGSIAVSGTVSGTVNGSQVPYQISGSATLAGVPCTVSVSGTARLEGDAIRVPYTGSTCFGPAQGEEVLRRPAPAPAPAPAPTPPPTPTPDPPAPPPPSGSSHHVGAGAATCSRAEQVVNATADEFPGLISPRGSEGEAVGAANELLRRIIWHLQLAGYQSGRQKNPSGAVSNDKLTVSCNGSLHAYDVFRDMGVAGQAITVIFLEVFPANALADAGIPD